MPEVGDRHRVVPDRRANELDATLLGEGLRRLRRDIAGHHEQPSSIVVDDGEPGARAWVGSTSPAGGLGMTGGIADAHNLVWKLAAVLHGWADPELLETHDVERRPSRRSRGVVGRALRIVGRSR